jgi:hypothetical protein
MCLYAIGVGGVKVGELKGSCGVEQKLKRCATYPYSYPRTPLPLRPPARLRKPTHIALEDTARRNPTPRSQGTVSLPPPPYPQPTPRVSQVRWFRLL